MATRLRLGVLTKEGSTNEHRHHNRVDLVHRQPCTCPRRRRIERRHGRRCPNRGSPRRHATAARPPPRGRDLLRPRREALSPPAGRVDRARPRPGCLCAQGRAARVPRRVGDRALAGGSPHQPGSTRSSARSASRHPRTRCRRRAGSTTPHVSARSARGTGSSCSARPERCRNLRQSSGGGRENGSDSRLRVVQ
jgi:hypothetical protein